MIQKDNVLDGQLIQELQDYIRNTDNHRSNYKSWSASMVKVSSPILLFNLNEELYNKIKASPKLNIQDEENMSMHYAMYPRLSYIPWHTDSHVKRAITIYLNKTWDVDYGGFLCYKEDQEFKCIIPEYNKSIEMKGNTPHSVLTVNINAPMRETLQIFMKD